MKLRKLTKDDVEIRLMCFPEDTPIEGNAMASGDDAVDKETEQWIHDQLERYNEWAWCCAKVVVYWKGFRASDTLGCCSYKSEEDFKQPGGYYDDMVNTAIERLNDSLANMHKELGTLEVSDEPAG